MSLLSIQSASASISSLVPLLQQISGPVTSSSVLPSSYGVVAASTEVSLGNLFVSIDGSNRVVARSTDAFYADASSETFAGASPVTTYSSNLDMLAGAIVSGDIGAVVGQSARVVLSDQTYGTGTWQILAQYVGSGWAISITRLSSSPSHVVMMMNSYHFPALYYSVNGGSSFNTLTLPTAPTGLYLCGVANSKYITYETGDNRLFSSQNGGSSFAQIAGVWDGGNIAMSQSGQYQFIANSGMVPRSIYRSTNYGVSFSAIQTLNTTSYVWVACSRTGQYVLALDQTVVGTLLFRVSSNYGATYTTVTVVSASQINRGVAVSATGQVMYGITHRGQVFKSTNFGVSFSLISTLPAQYVSPNTSHNMGTISCSADGSLLLAADCSGYLFRSADGGATWSSNLTVNGQPQSVAITDPNNCFYNAAMSADGKYQIAGGYYSNTDPSLCVSSSDYGLTWTTLPNPLGNVGAYVTAISP